MKIRHDRVMEYWMESAKLQRRNHPTRVAKGVG
jgi:hypothetical protein